MAIISTSAIVTAYRAEGLGDVKPKILIGGMTEKFVPNMNISFECESSTEQFFININRPSATVDKEVSSLALDKLSLSIGNETDIWHIDAKGRLKWDIEFKTKPTTNIFSWALTHSVGLEFHYQPVLTQEQVARGCKRPDDVIGSYAVYCNQSGHFKDADVSGNTTVNYTTGKLLHIYRPLCRDAKGTTTWASLLIDKGTLTITIPQKWLDTAVYPVTLDPTIGYTSVGASDGGADPNWLVGLQAAAPSSSGTATGISVYTISYWDNRHFKGVLIDHTHGDVIVTNGVGAAVTLPNDETWAWRTSSFATGPTIVAGTVYYPSFISDNGLLYAFDTVANSRSTNTSTSYATPANTGGWTYENHNERFSIYCTYTEAAGAPCPQRRKYQHLLVR